MVRFEKNVEGSSERALALFLGKARRAVGLSGTVDLVVTSNARMRSLNRQFRKQDKPTDVLSFPAIAEPAVSPRERMRYPNNAGEIAISADIAVQNGRSFGHGAAVELKVLVLHGVLHLAGHDHESDDGQMARKELKLRRKLALPDGLIERAGAVRADKDSEPIGVPRRSASRNDKGRHQAAWGGR